MIRTKKVMNAAIATITVLLFFFLFATDLSIGRKIGQKTRSFPSEKRIFAAQSLPAAATTTTLDLEKHCRKWGVVETELSSPSEAVRRFLYRTDWCLVIVANNKLTSSYSFTWPEDRVFFLSANDQAEMRSDFVDSLSWGTLKRKSVGYLFAIAKSAEVIFDFDDDDMLKFWIEGAAPDPGLDIDLLVAEVANNEIVKVTVPQFGKQDTSSDAFNLYPYLGCPVVPCQPRGFPSSFPSSFDIVTEDMNANKLVVLQSPADHNPDITYEPKTKDDGIYFSKPSPDSALLVSPINSFSPLNAHATLHFHSAHFALYLPSTAPPGLADVWRGYISQALFRILGLRVGFLPRPIVTRDIITTAAAIGDNDAKTMMLVDYLAKWSPPNKDFGTMEEAVEELWVDLYEHNFVDLSDVKGIQLWLKALNSVGYQLPSISDNGKSSVLVNDHIINLDHIGAVMVRKRSGMPENCSKMKAKKRFFMSEFHVGTRMDLPSIFAGGLGQKVVMTETHQEALLHTHTPLIKGIFIYEQLSNTLKNYNNYWSDLTPALIQENFDFFQSHSAIQNTDAFVCSFPSAMCELWKLFEDKSIVFLPAHRYNLGRCRPDQISELHEWLMSLYPDKRHVVGAMSRYDLEYLKYYLDVPKAKLLSSLSGFYTAGNVYQPSKKEVLLITTNNKAIKKQFRDLIDKVTTVNGTNIVELRKFYRSYQFSDLVQHPALVYLPYSVMSYKMTEFYSLAIPIFVPSAKYYRLNFGLGPDRTASSPPYCSKSDKLDQHMKKQNRSHHPYSPNTEFMDDPEAEMYWLQLSDFYEWPFVQTFDDADDLLAKLAPGAIDLQAVHRGMKEAYETRQYETLEQWCEIIPNLRE